MYGFTSLNVFRPARSHAVRWVALAFLLVFVAALHPVASAHADDLSNSLSAATYQRPYKLCYLDEAKTKAIAVTGEKDSYGGAGNANIWLVTGSGAKFISGPYNAVYAKSPRIYSAKGAKLFSIEVGGYGSGSTSYVWRIKGNSVKRVKFLGMGFAHAKGNQFTAIRDKFDWNRSSNGLWTGHTYNRYYFKWDGSKFTEYGGRAISEAQLKKAKNGASVLKAVKKRMSKLYSGAKARVGKMYYRANGIVNINVSCPDGSKGRNFCNVTLKLSGKKLVYWDSQKWKETSLSRAMQGGTVVKKTGRVKASYPKRFPVR